MSFETALKSFIGYLEGSGKSFNTITNYRLDLLGFRNFLIQQSSQKKKKPIQLQGIEPKDLLRFHDDLVRRGQKANTRRRKFLTVNKFFSYLVQRKKLPLEFGKKVPSPQKIERVPVTVSTQHLLQVIEALPRVALLEARNRLLLWILAETGAQVTEVAQLRFDDFTAEKNSIGGWVQILGKGERKVPVSHELREEIQVMRRRSPKSPWLFTGFNRQGPLGGAISARGVELVVKHYAPQFTDSKFTPRTLRHSVVLHWFEQGLSRAEIQARLGLKTAYAFRSYEPLLKAK